MRSCSPIPQVLLHDDQLDQSPTTQSTASRPRSASEHFVFRMLNKVILVISFIDNRKDAEVDFGRKIYILQALSSTPQFCFRDFHHLTLLFSTYSFGFIANNVVSSLINLTFSFHSRGRKRVQRVLTYLYEHKFVRVFKYFINIMSYDIRLTRYT